jgi:hypothetical protein
MYKELTKSMIRQSFRHGSLYIAERMIKERSTPEPVKLNLVAHVEKMKKYLLGSLAES